MLKQYIILLVMVFCVSSCAVSQTQLTARRYVEIDNDFLTRFFSVLEKEEVQKDLKLSKDQIEQIKEICISPSSNIPELQQLIAEYKGKKGISIPTEQEKRDFEEKLSTLTTNYQTQKLSTVLSPKQKERLDQILLQVQGPTAVLNDSKVANSLELTETQKENMENKQRFYKEELRDLYGHYGRQQINPIIGNETRDKRIREIENLAGKITSLEKKIDKAIIAYLTDEQQKKWAELQGKPLTIKWDLQNVFESPFAEN